MAFSKDDILREAEAVAGEVRAFRRHIHANPELSFREYETAEYIESVLDSFGIPHSRIAGTGVLARIEGRGELSEAIVLRADIDALPVHEKNTCDFASANDGVMHACGHDTHAAVLLGVLSILNRHKDVVRGTVFGLFQPGEEVNPGGASLVLAEDPFKEYNVRAVIGEHIDPELPTGIFGFRPGKYMASSDEVRITVRGEGGHAAMPQKLKDPIPAAAEIILAAKSIPGENPDPSLPSVLAIGKVIADGATNIIPDKVYMEGTFRAFDEEWRKAALDRLEKISEDIAGKYGVETEVNVGRGFPCVVNSPELVSAAIKRTEGLLGKDSVVSLELRTTAEDFGFYTQKYPSLFYRFGAGGRDLSTSTAGKLHSAHFNPDEDAFGYAVAVMVNLALNLVE